MATKTADSLDNGQNRTFIQFFKSLPEKPSTTIRFFNRTDYYTVHGEDATLAAKEVFRTTSFIKVMKADSDTLNYLNLNKSQFETLLRDLLLVKNYRVEVYVNKGGKSSNSWTLEYKGSPGNLAQFEEVLFSGIDQLEGTSIIAVKYESKTKTVGVSIINTVESSFSVTEFNDDEYFTNLEAVLVQFGPKECIIPSESSPEYTNMKKIAERCGILVTLKRKGDFSSDVFQDLNRLLKFKEGQQQNANALPESNLVHAMSSLNAGIKYLELCADNDNFGKFQLTFLDHGRFVHLDSAAVRALSISGQNCQQNHTLTGLLDKCRTPHGHRLLQQWVKQPLRDINVINERHDIVELFVNEPMLRQSLYDEHLRKIPDLQVLSKKLVRKKANLQDCYRIYQAIERLPLLVETLKYDENVNPTLNEVIIKPIDEHFKDMSKFQEMVSSTLDMSLIEKGEYLVKPEFDEDLQNLHDKMEEVEELMNKEMNKVARNLSVEPGKVLKLESNSQHGYYFRVSLKEEKSIRNKGYTQLDANKSGVRFRSNELTRLNEEYITAREDYTEHQQSVVTEVVTIALGYSNTLHQISSVLAHLDVLCSFAVVAASAPQTYVRPVMKPKGSGVFNLKQVRHPCLEVLDNVSYIPNDVSFNQDDTLFYIITGPNMGGKSTYIRSIGVVALLAHIGSLVPCDEAEIPILDAILARVGANDSQIKGMSTFMVEMVESASILKTATKDSLVIIDELGRGTSTYEGCGIAWAIAEYLSKEAKPFCLFATHFHELTRLSDEINEVKNLHVTAVTSDDTLTLLYKVKPGACDQSFGIHVANMAKFPQHVIKDAKRKLAELEDFQSSIEAETDVKKRQIIKEGEIKIRETLEKIKQFPKNLTEEEIKSRINLMKNELNLNNNPYLNLLINKKCDS